MSTTSCALAEESRWCAGLGAGELGQQCLCAHCGTQQGPATASDFEGPHCNACVDTRTCLSVSRVWYRIGVEHLL